jgi:rod shape determining protein RodA
MKTPYFGVDNRGEDSCTPVYFTKVAKYFATLEYVQIIAVLFFLGTGLLFIHTTGIQSGKESFFIKQIYWISAGVVGWIIASIIDYRKLWIKVASILFYIASIFLLIIVLKFGIKVFGSTRWLSIAGFRLQPSEFAKPALALLLATLCSASWFKIHKIHHLLLSFVFLTIPFFLILIEPDLGSACILVPIYVSIIFLAGIKWKVLISVALLALTLGGLFTANEIYGTFPKLMLKKHQRARIEVFLNPEANRFKSGYNAYQAKLAVGSGGFTGKGIGRGTQNSLGFLPQTVSNNDFIFSVIAEETGFMGCLSLILGYILLLYSIIRVAFVAQDLFGKLYCIGIASMLFTHIYVNMGMSIGIAPISGLSLPFVSYGGSFIVMGMTSLGLVQSVFRYHKEDLESDRLRYINQ